MSNIDKAVVSKHDAAHGSFKSYTIGLALSLICTFAAYFLASYHLQHDHEMISHRSLLAALMTLAVTQLVVQLVFFLHLGKESKPRWNLMIFAFMLLVLVIVVFGSLWIMSHLDYHHDMSPSQTDEYLLREEGIEKHSH